MSAPRVTVMIPSYNYERYLVECVESAVGQIGVDLDIVIVENASTDGSLVVAQRLAAQHPCVRLVVHPDNQGIISSFNRCRDEVRGDYAVLLCADDQLTPGSLARSVAFMEDHPDVGVVYGPTIDFASREEITPNRLAGEPRPALVYDGEEWIVRRCRAGTNPIRAPEAVMRWSVFQHVGQFDPACPHTSDLNLWLRIAAESDVAFLPGPAQALYRKHGENYSELYLNDPLPDLTQRWQAYSRFFDTLGTRPERPEWERSARSRLAAEARYAATRVYVTRDGDAAAVQLDGLIALANELDPAGEGPVERVGWIVRRKLGPRRALVFPPFLPRGALRRLGRTLAERRRVRTGV